MTLPSLFPRRRERPRTCLADPTEMQLPPPTGLFKVWDISPEQYRRGRKYWEWDYLVDCAERLNLLRPDARALGMGVGREVLMFYFARHCQEVIATDLYSSDTEWREANTGALDEIYQAAPFDYPRERLKVEVADMRKTNYPDNSFDFVWSCGSIEHVPTLFDVYQTLAETYRVLKPGGYALITTEYCLFDPPYLLNGMNAMDENLVELFLAKLAGLELVGPIDLSYNCAHPLCAVATRQYMFAQRTSSTQQFVLPKDYIHMMGLSAIIPIGFVLKRLIWR
jgi:SAM-dependent methyltransferase